MWHIFNRNNPGDNTLVTMASCHLVARLNAAFHCNIDLHHFLYTRCQIISAGDLSLFLFKDGLNLFALLLELLSNQFNLLIHILVAHANFKPLLTTKILKIGLRYLISRLD